MIIRRKVSVKLKVDHRYEESDDQRQVNFLVIFGKNAHQK